MQCTYNVTSRRVHVTIVAVEKQCLSCSECVLARTRLGVCVCVRESVWVGARARACAFARVSILIHHTTRMHHIVISASLAAPNSATLSHKVHGFRGGWGGDLLIMKCVLIFSTTFT
jgi:hypothetical protein